MANKVNPWEKILKLANKDLKKFNAEIGVYDHDDVYSVTIIVNGVEEEYADGYYEDELGDLINDAWGYAMAKKKHNVEKLVEAYFELTDAEKDEFLRLTENQ